MDIEIVAVETTSEGSKGLFDLEEGRRIVRTKAEDFSESLRKFCAAFSAGLGDFEDAAAKLTLETIEVSVELTVKGEVRLIAAASSETKGSVKLVFSRRR